MNPMWHKQIIININDYCNNNMAINRVKHYN